MSTRVSLTIDGVTARLLLRSDDGENRIDGDTLAELRAYADGLREAPELRAVIIAGDGNFSLGWTQQALESFAAEREVKADPFGVFADLPKPVIAQISGAAISAGLELALACDIRLAAHDARFAFPETAAGLIPLAGGTQRLPRLVGPARASAMILLGQEIDGRTALDWGLVNEAVPTGELAAAAARIAGVIASRGPIAERFAKEAVRDGMELPLARALRYELDLTVLLQTTADRAEGVAAFAEKRPPHFTGR